MQPDPQDPQDYTGPVGHAAISEAIGVLHGVLDSTGDAPLWPVADEDLESMVREVLGLIPRLQARTHRLLAEAEKRDAATATANVSTAAWYRQMSGVTGPESAKAVKLALALEAHDPTRLALAAGGLLLDQAQVITAAVDALPASVGPEDREEAERHLLGLAMTHDARELKVLGRHLWEVIDPDAAEQALAKALEREEAAAARDTHYQGWDDGKGRYHFAGIIGSLHGAMLETALSALLNPDRPDPITRDTDDGAKRPTPELKGEAFTQLIERYPTKRLPKTSGMNATVIVTIPLAVLEGRLGKCQILGTPLLMSPTAARRMACAAGVLPAVLDTDGYVIELGRKKRKHDQPQRISMSINQRGLCGIHGCTRPTSCCDAHHPQPWSLGGHTSVKDGVMICPRHHTLAHKDTHDLVKISQGKYKFVRRT